MTKSTNTPAQIADTFVASKNVQTKLEPIEEFKETESPLKRCMTDEEIEILSANSVSQLEQEFLTFLKRKQSPLNDNNNDNRMLHLQHNINGQQHPGYDHQQNNSHQNPQPIRRRQNSYPLDLTRSNYYSTHNNHQQLHQTNNSDFKPKFLFTNLESNQETKDFRTLTISQPHHAFNLSSPIDIPNYMTLQNPLVYPTSSSTSSINSRQDNMCNDSLPVQISKIKKEPDSNMDDGYSPTEHSQSYSDQTSSQSMVSSFPYGAGNSESMYAQQSNMHNYMDGGHGNTSQNPMFQSYTTQSGHQGSMGLGVSPQAIGVAQQAQYLQPGQAASQRVPISHTTRASPVTVQWLLENYETSDGVSLPRSTLYHHYLRHCAENKIDAVNAASFGKLIRSVFVGLKTRRLGTRGNSKYHYYGIRVKPNSPLARLTDDTQVALRATPSSSKRSLSTTVYDEERRSESGSNVDESNLSQYKQYMGDTGEALPDGPPIELVEPLPEGVNKDDIMNFGNYYRSHSEALLEAISTLQFTLVEALWQSFYKSPAATKADNGTLNNNDFSISKNDLIVLCNYQPVQVFVKETDYILYQKLVSILVPDVLRAVPSSLTQMIRNFAKSLENWLLGSMSEMPKEIVNVKAAAVSAFSQTLRRYTSLNHLAQAARAVLLNSQQINQMWNDLNKVDFNNVQEQSSWVCQCDESLITKLEADFKQTLAQQQTLEQWAKWLECVVAMVLQPHEGRESYPKAARNFLLNWSFYSSMIIRDLTLRSAASFGSFHLIRLLYDEYMFYLIEHKVAAHTGKSPMSVMAECVGGLSSNCNGNQNNDDDEDFDENSNDGLSSLTSDIGGKMGEQGGPMLSQVNAAFDEPSAKKMKQDSS